MSAKILAVAGSTRTESFNKKLINVAAQAAKDAGAEVTVVDLRDYPMPIYDGDLEAAEGMPAAAQQLKALFKGHNALLIASPEYNSSISAVLKNAIDWISRPEEGEPMMAAFSGKTAAIMSASPGALGGMRALAQLRALLENIQVMVIPPQVSLSKSHEMFTKDGAITDDRQLAKIHNVAKRLVEVTSLLNPV